MDGLMNKVWYLERQLFQLFPETDALEWDNPGLLVGDKEEAIRGIAIALDPTIQTIRMAHDRGCNVLFTHHPAFLRSPKTVLATGPTTWSRHGSDADSVEQAMAGPLIYEAAKLDVSLISMHTNFDRSASAQHVLPDALGLTYLNPVEQTTRDKDEGVGSGGQRGGLGQLSSTPLIDLASLARRCRDVFGVTPRVWGPPDQQIELIVTIPGSAWPLINDATKCEFDCCICGETRYHTALAAVAAGNSIIELGHDISENLYVDVFYNLLVDLGYPEELLYKIPPITNWWTV